MTTKTVWHSWFAWYPVNVSQSMPEPVWLITVERKWVPGGGFWLYRRKRSV